MQAIRDAIRILVEDKPLEEALTERAAREILEGEATPAQIGAFLATLNIRGERPEHLRAFARVMRSVAQPVQLPHAESLVDTCGTGGDGASTFNVSTAAAFVAAGAGARIAKHGNRAVTGAQGSGSADVLAALGVNIECPPEVSARCVEQCGFGFFFAPQYHGALRHAGPARREIGVRSILNLMGPLANPAGAARQVIGVGQPGLTEMFASVLAALGSRHVMVVHGLAGDGGQALDEISLLGPTRVSEAVLSGEGRQHIKTFDITPEQFGLKRCALEALAGGSGAGERAAQLRDILQGKTQGARREITLLNAAAALLVADLATDWMEALGQAARSIDCGAAWHVAETLIRLTNSEGATA